MTNDRHNPAKEPDRLEDAGPEERVLLHDLLLFGRQRSGLRQNCGRDADLAERVEERRVPEVAELVLAQLEALADGDRIRRDLALVVLAVVVARHDRGHERRDGREVRLVELPVQADRAHRRRADAREDPDELALLVGEHMRLVPRDEEHADGLIGGTQRVHEEGFVSEPLEELARVLGRVGAARERHRLAGVEHARYHRRALRERENIARRLSGGEREVKRVAALVDVDGGHVRLEEVDD